MGHNYLSERILVVPGPLTLTTDPIVVSSDELSNIDSHPIPILEPPGAGLYYLIVDTIYQLDFGTTPYANSGSDNGGIFYGSPSLENGADDGDATLPTMTESYLYSSDGYMDGPLSGIENTGLFYGIPPGSGYSGGDGTLTITVSYQILTVAA
jgi:hypothetical protein